MVIFVATAEAKVSINESEVVKFLNDIKWPVSPHMFNALFRASPTVTFELVVFQESPSGELEVVLLKRPDDDTEFPGMLHIPGTVMRRGDTKEKALDRLRKEMGALNCRRSNSLMCSISPWGTDLTNARVVR